jgi:hypothetical protein
MSEKPKRKWFQFHLSTALLFLLVAGAMSGANLRYQNWKTNPASLTLERNGIQHALNSVEIDEAGMDHRVQELYISDGLGLQSTTFSFQYQGWPCIYRIEYMDASEYNNIHGAHWYVRGLTINLLVAVAIFACAVLVLEFLLRRREARKT